MIRKALGLSFMVGVASMFAFACGDDDAAGDRYPTVDSFCAAKAELECTQGSVAACGVAVDACKAKRKDACLAAGGAASGQGRTYTPSKAEACLNLVSGMFAAGAANDKTKLDSYNDTCGHVFAGAKVRGDTCTNAYDCSGSLYCDLDKTPSRCSDKSTPKPEGAGCANSGDICATGLFCKSTEGFVCRPRSAVGITCNAPTIPCVETAFCNNGVCAALGAVGTACTTDAECSTSFCNQDTKTCAGRQFPTENGTCKDFSG